MKPETKIYSDFIKRSNVVPLRHGFSYKLEGKWINVRLEKDDDGMWYADNDDKCYTKKAAIYYYLKNHTDLK